MALLPPSLQTNFSIDDPAIKSLLVWAQQCGSHLHPSVEIYFDPVTGLSFRAQQDVPPGTELVTTSYNASLSYLNAVQCSATPCFTRQNSAPFPPHFIAALSLECPYVLGNFFLMQQYLLKEDSHWWPYIRSLPQPDQLQRLGHPALWPETDLTILKDTNVGPAINQRKRGWREEWEKAKPELRDSAFDSDEYSLDLYLWAASIFGTRSFRTSLTVHKDAINVEPSSSDPLVLQIMDHIANDMFAVLLPVTDIGNHNGDVQVDWVPTPSDFRILNQAPISSGSQIYNSYGTKSNSELLAGYGFILLERERDTVNIRIQAPEAAKELRRKQRCHRRRADSPYQEFMFHLSPVTSDITGSLGMPKIMSTGLLDTAICVCVNDREQRLLLDDPKCCPERDDALLYGPLARSTYRALLSISQKIEKDMFTLRSALTG